jgi:hypothetical protein
VNEGRLPRPTGIVTPRLRRAVAIYRTVEVYDGLDVDARLGQRAVLTTILARMSPSELANYYARVRRLQDECPL